MASEVSLTFTGDIGFDKYMDKKWEDEDVKGFMHDFLVEEDGMGTVEVILIIVEKN